MYPQTENEHSMSKLSKLILHTDIQGVYTDIEIYATEILLCRFAGGKNATQSGYMSTWSCCDLDL